ncbi:hypothetical protein [Actinosynnema sp. NPDC020468]|uniref:hypothetical protein n=1 Tax=Actinosynnema sp. NPDC020468 TaxID=3154488 RepID=UPI0033DD40F9
MTGFEIPDAIVGGLPVGESRGAGKVEKELAAAVACRSRSERASCSSWARLRGWQVSRGGCDSGVVAAEDQVEFGDQSCGLRVVGVDGDSGGGEVRGDAAEEMVFAEVEVAWRVMGLGVGAGVAVSASVGGAVVDAVGVHPSSA